MLRDQIIVQLSKSAANVDATDPVGLYAVQELLTQLHADLASGEHAEVAAEAARCAGLVEQLIFRELDDAETALSGLFRSIDFLQEAVRRISDGIEPPAPPGVDADAAAGAIDEELLGAWLTTCTGLLNDVEATALALEAGKADEEPLAELRRHIHTLKGECQVLSLREAQRMCHETESLIEASLESGLPFPAEAVLALVDWMKAYVTGLEQDPACDPPPTDGLIERLRDGGPAWGGDGRAEGGSGAGSGPSPAEEAAGAGNGERVVFSVESGDENLTDFICEAREHIAASEAALLELEQDLENQELINTVFRAFHTVKGVAGFLHLDPIVELAHNAEYLLDEARKGSLKLDSGYLDIILRSCDMLAALLSALEGHAAPFRNELQTLIGSLKRALVESPAVGEARTAPVRRGLEPAAAEDGEVSQGDGSPRIARRKADASVKVNTQRLDNLVTMVGELVIAQQMVLQDMHVREIKDQRFQRNLGHTGKIIRDLQEVAMSLRMVTLKGTFQKMARLVRDVSAKAGKQVRFHMEGEETELDRTVVEEVGDPLVHIIRNACDHGIESPADRRGAGKPETGNLTLRAYHRGGSIIIEVADDGRGLDRERILAKALERGLLPADRETASIPDSEVYNLILLPGFSTAQTITDISGRGVGMDVVRRNIEALRGKLEIDSKPGKGTTFRMALPLTMAIIDGMIVRVGAQRYVIPTLSMELSHRPMPEQLHRVANRGEMVSIRGSLLPVFRLSRLFGLAEQHQDLSESLLIVLESADTRCALVVDEILGQQQVVIKSLGQGLGALPGVSGGAILGDGRVALIIDVGELISQATVNPEDDLQPA